MKDLQRPAGPPFDLSGITTNQNAATIETRLRQKMRLAAKPAAVLPVLLPFAAPQPNLSPAMTLGLALASTATLGWAIRSWYLKS